jgi:excisionase family DNA binding protein
MTKALTERLLSLSELSELLGVPVATLYGWRHRGDGLAGYRVGRHVRYRRAEVEEWLELPRAVPSWFEGHNCREPAESHCRWKCCRDSNASVDPERAFGSRSGQPEHLTLIGE